jgi:hypothetical protein
VKYQTFAAWIQKRKRAGPARGLPAPATLALVELEAPAVLCRDGSLLLILPGGSELHVASQAAVPLAAALTREYLEDVLTRLSGMMESEAFSLIPANWLRARQGKPVRKAA